MSTKHCFNWQFDDRLELELKFSASAAITYVLMFDMSYILYQQVILKVKLRIDRRKGTIYKLKVYLFAYLTFKQWFGINIK